MNATIPKGSYGDILRTRHQRSLATSRLNFTKPVKTVMPFILRKTGLSLSVQAETFFGRKMAVVLPDMVSVTIWRYGFFEEDVCAFLLWLLRPGDTFIDVGGHFGFFSMLGRELVSEHGKVVTFEPMPNTREVLRRNMTGYGVPGQYEIIPAAAGSSTGTVKFKDFGLAGSAFSTSQKARNSSLSAVGEVDVDVLTLDGVIAGLDLTSVRLIKIDAENAEYDVVVGCLQTLRTLRPAVILEAGDEVEGSTRRFIDIVMSEGYRPYEFRNWELHPHQPVQSYGYKNLLMVPADKVDDMIGKVSPLCASAT